MRRLKRYAIFCALVGIILIGTVVFGLQGGKSTFEKRITAAADRAMVGEGECELDLNALFADMEWDTVSIFVAGNAGQIRDTLQLDNDISDGIVFSDNGKHVLLEISTYDYNHDAYPLISFYVDRAQIDDAYYASRPRDQAVLHVEKFLAHDGKYRYAVSFP